MNEQTNETVMHPSEHEQGRGFMDFSWIMLLLLLCIWGGDNLKTSVMETAKSKIKEDIKDGEQLIRTYEQYAEQYASSAE